MVKREENVVTKIAAKGVLTSAEDGNLVIFDEKKEIEDVVSADDFQKFVGSEIVFSISKKEESEE